MENAINDQPVLNVRVRVKVSVSVSVRVSVSVSVRVRVSPRIWKMPLTVTTSLC